MPLLDHFHPPLSLRRYWESFHATWTVCLGDALSAVLPENYFVEVQTHLGAAVEVDVATFDEVEGNGARQAAPIATLPRQLQALPAPPLTMPAVFPQGFEVRVFSTRAGPTLVGAIELASPGNKDRPEIRRAFAAKCASYLYQAVSLIVVDVVTERSANLRNETMRLMEAPEQCLLPETGLYAVAYRPVRRGEKGAVDLWPATFAVGNRLPVLPLVLSPDLRIPVDLEAAYADACRRRRLV